LPALLLVAGFAALATDAAGTSSGERQVRRVRSSGERHLRLVRAEPAPDTTIATAPAALRLHFSERPEIRGTSLRLSDADAAEIGLGRPVLDPSDDKVLNVAVTGAMRPGAYTVAWRTMSSDGHVVRGEFRFALAPAGAPR
jgi:methionine-rich copper-binding protein CopC